MNQQQFEKCRLELNAPERAAFEALVDHARQLIGEGFKLLRAAWALHKRHRRTPSIFD